MRLYQAVSTFYFNQQTIMKKHIPNSITCCNLISGCIATYFAFQGNFHSAFLFIIIGAVFDFFDGFVARLLHVASPIGKELDSLADDITFGMAPATIVFAMLRELLTATTCPANCPLTIPAIAAYLPFTAYLIAAFSALRLAKFNLDTRQSVSFIGLPTPANALLWASLTVSLHNHNWFGAEPWMIFAILGGIILSCWMLVCEIPMFALKFKTYGIKGNELRYSFILVSMILLFCLGWIGFSAIILLYMLTSILNNLFGTKISK